jgi:hypothetical protein
MRTQWNDPVARWFDRGGNAAHEGRGKVTMPHPPYYRVGSVISRRGLLDKPEARSQILSQAAAID